MIKVYNVFSEDEIKQIEKKFTDNFPWYLSTADNHATVTKDVHDQFADDNTVESTQLTNFLFIDGKGTSSHYAVGAEILEQFCMRTNTPITKLIRIKANLQLKQDRTDDQYNTMHVDGYEPHMVMIYYVNDSDGQTILFNKNRQLEHRISAKAGMCLMFPGHILHAGQPPKLSQKRILINYNFLQT
jgi:hypothetical protein